MKKNYQGFTLAEMLIVVAIIGVLIAILVPSFTTQLEKARETADAGNLRAAVSECMNTALQGETDPATKDVALTQKTSGWSYVDDISGYSTSSTEGLKSADANKTITVSCSSSGEVSFSSKAVDCLAKGTKILMSDSTLKNIEDLQKGDSILTFNHELGIFEAQRVFLVYKSEQQKSPFTLHFSGDISVSVVGDHVFFEQESLKYVAIFKENAEEFIGKHFYNAVENTYEELLDVCYENEPVDYFEIYTEYNFNCVAESMLNVPFDSMEVLNIYSFNEDLTIDHEQLEKDIQEFGLYEYPEDASY